MVVLLLRVIKLDSKAAELYSMNEVRPVAVPWAGPHLHSAHSLGEEAENAGERSFGFGRGAGSGRENGGLEPGRGPGGPPCRLGALLWPRGPPNRMQGATLVSLWPHFIKLPPPPPHTHAGTPARSSLPFRHPTPSCVFVHPRGSKYQFDADSFMDL